MLQTASKTTVKSFMYKQRSVLFQFAYLSKLPKSRGGGLSENCRRKLSDKARSAPNPSDAPTSTIPAMLETKGSSDNQDDEVSNAQQRNSETNQHNGQPDQGNQQCAHRL